MTDQQIAEQIVGCLACDEDEQLCFSCADMAAEIVKALTLARSEEREEGMKETKAARADHSQYAAPLATSPTDRG